MDCKESQSPKSICGVSLLQLNFLSNVYGAPILVFSLCFCNSTVILPRVWGFIRGLCCSVSGVGAERQSSGVDGKDSGGGPTP